MSGVSRARLASASRSRSRAEVLTSARLALVERHRDAALLVGDALPADRLPLLPVLRRLDLVVVGEREIHLQIIALPRREKHAQPHRRRKAYGTLGLVLLRVARVLRLAVVVRREPALLRVLVVDLGLAALVRREKPREIPARRRQRQHLLAARGMIRRDEGPDEVRVQRLDEAPPDGQLCFSIGHRSIALRTCSPKTSPPRPDWRTERKYPKRPASWAPMLLVGPPRAAQTGQPTGPTVLRRSGKPAPPPTLVPGVSTPDQAGGGASPWSAGAAGQLVDDAQRASRSSSRPAQPGTAR